MYDGVDALEVLRCDSDAPSRAPEWHGGDARSLGGALEFALNESKSERGGRKREGEGKEGGIDLFLLPRGRRERRGIEKGSESARERANKGAGCKGIQKIFQMWILTVSSAINAWPTVPLAPVMATVLIGFTTGLAC
jgi:hypothetical protein